MKNKEFYEKLVKNGHSDHYVSFVASLDSKEISLLDFTNLFRKVPKKSNGRGGQRGPSQARHRYKYLVENAIIKKPNLL